MGLLSKIYIRRIQRPLSVSIFEYIGYTSIIIAVLSEMYDLFSTNNSIEQSKFMLYAAKTVYIINIFIIYLISERKSKLSFILLLLFCFAIIPSYIDEMTAWIQHKGSFLDALADTLQYVSLLFILTPSSQRWLWKQLNVQEAG